MREREGRGGPLPPWHGASYTLHLPSAPSHRPHFMNRPPPGRDLLVRGGRAASSSRGRHSRLGHPLHPVHDLQPCRDIRARGQLVPCLLYGIEGQLVDRGGERETKAGEELLGKDQDPAQCSVTTCEI